MTQPPNAPEETWHYETAVEAIEVTVAQLEQGNLPLAEVFSQFEQAVQQLRQCERFLQEKQQQVDLLIETLEDP
jgi:exodeoxyribonuclease VII small subunit